MTEPTSERALSEEQLSEIEARAGKATQGPWSAIQLAESDWAWYCYTNYWSYERATGSTWWSRADAEFQAHARTDVPALCAALRAARAEGAGAAATARDLRSENERLRAALERAKPFVVLAGARAQDAGLPYGGAVETMALIDAALGTEDR